MRLIDADALIQSVGDRWTDYDRELVDSFPTIDAVPVVRCRECKFFDKGQNDSESWEWCNIWERDCESECYCRYGQRRENWLYESLKRGVEEAIAYEKGEIECRTETREDGTHDSH